MFKQDPREIPFLRSKIIELQHLANQNARNLLVSEEDDFGFMMLQFLYKQMQHAESVLSLEPNRDCGLVARTMIEGLYQLLWTSQQPEQRARRWRSFAIIHDWRLMQAQKKAGIPIDPADELRNSEGMKHFAHLHTVAKPKDPSDPYHKNWRGGASLSQMADAVGRELYDGPYTELSDWEHWGVSGIGDSITRTNERLTVSSTSDRVAGLSLLAAFQSIFQTLQVVVTHFSLALAKALHDVEAAFLATMQSFYPETAAGDPLTS